MDHNEFKLMEDLVTPFKKFIKQIDPELANKRLADADLKKSTETQDANITK